MNDPIQTILELRAQVLEYEHALEHVADCTTCDDCKRLVQSALDGLGREDFKECVEWRINGG